MLEVSARVLTNIGISRTLTDSLQARRSPVFAMLYRFSVLARVLYIFNLKLVVINKR